MADEAQVVGRLGDAGGFRGSTQDFKHHCCMHLVPADEMRTANSHALPPHAPVVFLGLLNRKPVHCSAVQHPVYEILNPTPVILPDELHCFGTVGPMNNGFGGGPWVRTSGVVEGMAVARQCISGPSTASRATWYAVEVTWGVRGGLTGAGEVVGARLDEGGEGGCVSSGGWGEASSLRHFSASESHGGEGGWSPNRRSSGKSPKQHSGSEGLEGKEEARLRGLDHMANCAPQCVGDERVGVGACPNQMSGSETQRSKPKTHFLASRGGCKQKSALCVG